MHIPMFFEPWPNWVNDKNGPPVELTYQLTTNDTQAHVHTLATFASPPGVGDEIALRVIGLAGFAVYEIVGVQHTLGHAVVDTLYLHYLRQDT